MEVDFGEEVMASEHADFAEYGTPNSTEPSEEEFYEQQDAEAEGSLGQGPNDNLMPIYIGLGVLALVFMLGSIGGTGGKK